MLTGGTPGIVNPLVSNILPAYNASQYDLIWINNQKIIGSTYILLDMLSRIPPLNVALVHQLPFVSDQPGLIPAIQKVIWLLDALKAFDRISHMNLFFE